MSLDHLTDKEIAQQLARRLRDWRVAPEGAALSQQELSNRSGMGVTPLRRFERTGGITLRNLVAIMRAMGLLDRLEELVPSPDEPGPLDILARERQAVARQRAPARRRKAAVEGGSNG